MQENLNTDPFLYVAVSIAIIIIIVLDVVIIVVILMMLWMVNIMDRSSNACKN